MFEGSFLRLLTPLKNNGHLPTVFDLIGEFNYATLYLGGGSELRYGCITDIIILDIGTTTASTYNGL